MNLAEGLAIVAGSCPDGAILPKRAGCRVAAGVASVAAFAREDAR